MARRDPLRNDGALGVFPDVDHLGAGIRLLIVVGECHRVKLSNRVVTLQDAARIFPGDRRASLYLGPRDLGVYSQTLATLGDKIVDPTLAVLIAWVPVGFTGKRIFFGTPADNDFERVLI
jgi:hypothetical protein